MDQSNTPPNEPEIDLGDIARGRRITAVTASELNLTPRQVARPKAVSRVSRALRRFKFMLQRVKY